MSFRLFVYYCALFGAWSGFLGWILGRLLTSSTATGLFANGMRGLMAGLVIAAGLSVIDSLWNVGARWGVIGLRVLVAAIVGGTGGLAAGLLGRALVGLSEFVAYFLAWTIAGMLIGAAIGAYEVCLCIINSESLTGAMKKFIKAFTGGTLGGFLGGMFAYSIGALILLIFEGKDSNSLLSPSSFGFVILGACIGLFVGLAQVILKDAWIKVEAGFRPGREMILTKDRTSVGRAEGVDIALFGDNGVEKMHGHIVNYQGQFFVEDQNTPGGIFVNDVRVQGRAPLNSNDLIRMGARSALRFFEKPKR